MLFSGHTTRKRFGQHWLEDESVLEKIIMAADLNSEDRVLEVGPGKGILTERLLSSKASSVHAIEIDRDLVVGLQHRFQNEPRFSLKEGDVLSEALNFPDGNPPTKVVANIPYNITGPLLIKLLGSLAQPATHRYKRLVLLLQKEVAERICANAGESNFSALSVRLQLLAGCRRICEVPPKAFVPPPKVYSAVIALEPISFEKRLDPVLAKQVEVLLEKAFLERRKMLRNTVGKMFPLSEIDEIAKGVGISLDQRPQEIAPKKWLLLAERLRNFF